MQDFPMFGTFYTNKRKTSPNLLIKKLQPKTFDYIILTICIPFIHQYALDCNIRKADLFVIPLCPSFIYVFHFLVWKSLTM